MPAALARVADTRTSPDYIRPIKSVTYWVDEDDLLLEHADHAGIAEAVRESLDSAMDSLPSKIEAARPRPAARQWSSRSGGASSSSS